MRLFLVIVDKYFLIGNESDGLIALVFAMSYNLSITSTFAGAEIKV